MRLSGKITIYMLIVGFLPLAVMGIIFLGHVEDNIRNTAHNTLDTLATEVGREVWRTVHEGYRNILLLAEHPVLHSTEATIKEQQEELTKTQKFHQLFKDISLVNLKGLVRASVFHSFRGTWKSTRWFKKASAGETVFSNIHSVLYPFDIVMTVATPIKDEKKNITGVLVGQIDLEPVWEIARNVPVGETGQVYIVNRHGIVVAAPDSDLILLPFKYDTARDEAINFNKNISNLTDKGGKKVLVNVPISESLSKQNAGWSVVIIQSESEAYATIYRTRQALIVSSLVCLFIVSVLSIFLSRQISRRINRLVKVTEFFGMGDFSRKVEGLGNDEIGTLGKAFNNAGEQLFSANLQRQEAEEELKKAHHDLELRVEERTSELAQAKEVAETANSTKSDFLANMSHELRTPLNHIIGFTELVTEEHFGELNPKQKEFLGDSIGSSYHLLSLINDILDLSKVESGKVELQPEPIELPVLINNSLMMVKEKAMKQGIMIATNLDKLPATIHADRRKLKQVMYNLLSNAVKFTPAKGSIDITGSIQAINSGSLQTTDGRQIAIPSVNGRNSLENHDFVRIMVQDTGIGLTPDNLERIFDSFHQVETSKSRQFEGTGLGLALTKTLIEMHGGTIWAESGGKDTGATFTFIIPVAAQAQNKSAVEF